MLAVRMLSDAVRVQAWDTIMLPLPSCHYMPIKHAYATIQITSTVPVGRGASPHSGHCWLLLQDFLYICIYTCIYM